jgi:hypothetical protein
MIKRSLLGFAALFALFTQAQEKETPVRCYTEEVWMERMQDPAYAERWHEKEALLDDVAGKAIDEDSLRIIPIVVHIIHAAGPENITDAQVHDMIRVINEDYSRTNADTSDTRAIFEPVAASMDIEFRLARKDEKGNCTSGIIRHYSFMTEGFPNNFKEVVSWDNTKYLNIFIVNSIYHSTTNGIIGYARFPELNGQTAIEDGVVARHFSVGAIGTAGSGFPQYNKGRTVTHEIGHYLDLIHPFQWGSCFGAHHNDECNDTPRATSAAYGCNSNLDQCTNDNGRPNMIENYMDYADDDCQNMFTNCQRKRSRRVINLSALRANLSDSANLVATGVLDTTIQSCKPGADAYPSRHVTCVGTPITFTENAYGDTYTSMEWVLPGSSSNGSSNSAIAAQYTQAGTYDFGLIVSNAQGADTINFEKQIVVVPNSGMDISGGYYEDFESVTPGEWNIQYSEMRGHFQRGNSASYSGNYSYWVNNFGQCNITHTTPDQSRDVEYLYMPPLDMTTIGDATLKFKYAYSQRVSGGQVYGEDQLAIQVSTTCGQTWQTRKVIGTNELITRTASSTGFYPTSNSHWDEGELSLLAFTTRDHIMIRFVFRSRNGNNFFIDDVSVTSNSSGIEEHELSQLKAYPNPFEDRLSLQFESSSFQNVALEVVDLQGKLIHEAQLQAEIGSNQFTIPTDKWSRGVYLVRVHGAFGTQVEKLIKQ